MGFSNHYLSRIFQKGRVPHTLLFHGREKAGIKEAALNFARKLLATQKKEPPDLHLYHPEEKSGLHSIESIRKLIDEAALAPFEGEASVFIIEDAERMQPAAANALLKILEEPLENRYFILLVTAIDEVLPTILSRSCEIAFHTEAEEKPDSYPEFLTAFFSGDYNAYVKAVKALEEKDDLNAEKVIDEIAEAWRKRYLLSQPDPDLAFARKVLAQLTSSRLALSRHAKIRAILDSLFFAIIP